MNQTSIHLKEHGIEIETIKGSQRTIKSTNLQAVQEILTRGERMETPLLPCGWGVQKYTRVNNREQFVISTPQTRHRASFDMRGEDGTRDHVPFEIVAPAALWIIYTSLDPARDTRQYIHGNAYALKNQVLSTKDQLYRFPFANTNERYICWGQRNPELGGSKSIQTVPDRFFAQPFNNDLDGGKFEPFRDKVKGRDIVHESTLHLLRYMDREVKKAEEAGETPTFRNDILIPTIRLEDAIRSGADQYLRG